MKAHPEIERKFLVRSFPRKILSTIPCHYIIQGYLALGNPNIRARLQIGPPFYQPNTSMGALGGMPDLETRDGWESFLTIKTRSDPNDWRTQKEWETPQLPPEIAQRVLAQCQNTSGAWLSKDRYTLGRFALDVFRKPALRGLAILEVELFRPDEDVPLPEGFECAEVTDDIRFANQNLAQLSRSQLILILAEYR